MYTNNMAKLFAEGGMNDDGGTVDPVSGNAVPPGAMQNEVRDDISAKLSEGEFVIPADVVRYIGLERLMKLRDEAKQGLSRMSEIGQMGNSDQVTNPEALHEGEDGFSSEIDDIMQEVDSEQMGEKKFGAGGFNEPNTDYLAKYNIPKTSITNPALDVRAYKNKEGRVMYITFFNDKPSIQIPAGYEFAGSAGQFIAETKKTDEAKPVVTATQTIESGGDGGGDGSTSGGGASVSTGQGIGASPIGIAIGAIANAISAITNPNPTPVTVVDAIASPSDAVAAANAAAANAAAVNNSLAIDNSPISENESNAAAVSANDAAAAANAASGVSGEGGSSDGSAGGSVGDSGDGSGSYAKGGLVAKRNKKTTPAQKRGIASKR